MASAVESVLNDVGLATLLPKFISERADVNVILAASDQDIIRLGISTIGDRCRLRDACRRRRYYSNIGIITSTSTASMSSSRSMTTPAVSSNIQTLITINNSPDHSNSTSSFFSQVREERSLLFAPRRTRGSSRTPSTITINTINSTGRSLLFSRKKPGSKTWTANFVCLADRLATKLPNSTQKQILQKAGLGFNRIKLDLKDNENQVYRKIISDDLDEERHCKGFPKLNNYGGFELMHSIANCRVLEPLNCPVTTKTLKSYVGHGKLYIRPIQKNLSVISIPQDDSDATLKEKCKFCLKEFLLQDLKNHVNMCLPAIFDYCDNDSSTSSTDDLPEIQLEWEQDKLYCIIHHKGHQIPPHQVMMEIMIQKMFLLLMLVIIMTTVIKTWLLLIAILQLMGLLLLLVVIMVMLHKTWI